MDIKGRMENGIITVTLAGRLDTAGAMEAEQHFLKYAESGSKFVLDFKDVEYITSAGIRALLTLYRTVSEKDGEVKIINENEAVKNVLVETEFAGLFLID